VVAGEQVYSMAPHYSIWVCDSALSRLLWSYSAVGTGCSTPVVGRDGTVYVLEGGVRVVALAARQPLARTPWPRFRGGYRNTGNLSEAGR
jgi:hypothetical protein